MTEGSVTADDETAQLRAALSSRPTIDLAKGVVMAARRCDEDTAFAELARVSMSCNIKVARLAELLVERVALRVPTTASADGELPAAARAAVARWLAALPHP